eukprot:9145332-Ditylum_brightwellii.AAC.1
MLFHGVNNSDDGADKHFSHLSQSVDCHLTERSKQNKHVVGNNDNGVGNSVDDSVDDSDDSTDKHLAHLLQVVGCHLTERSKQNKCVVDNKDNGVDNSVDNSVD